MLPKMLLSLFCFWFSLGLADSGLQPFFDDDPATRHAPPDPSLDDLDLDVLTLCGDWGSEVQARDFERMLLQPIHAERVGRLQQALGYRIYSRSEDREQFVRELRRVWFEQRGFQHVFCGEPGVGADLGGFHYAPRYWQAQDRGWAGYRKLAADPRRRTLAKCRAGFGHRSTASGWSSSTRATRPARSSA